MLYDAEFLKKLDESRTKTTYARIIALSHNETPIETIEGRFTQGSINLDGDSAVRRTCSLTMIASEYDYNNYLWGLNTKFKLEVGLENLVDSTYPSIIWFNQGIYFISSFNTAKNTNSFTITIQGKDKMCALNGEIGGALTSSVDFGTIEEIDKSTNTRRLVKLPIKDIIYNIVSQYGGEPAHNIIINDLDMVGLELLEYRYDEDTPLYLYRDADIPNSVFNNVLLGNNIPCWVVNDSGDDIAHEDLSTVDETCFELLISPLSGSSARKKIYFNNETKQCFYLAKIKYGDTAGYRFTELVYPGDLIGNVGESLTSILDKIKNILGSYEYFYNLDGQFVFQKKKTYVNSSWNPVTQDSDGRTFITDTSQVAYTFTNGELVTAFNNNPNLSNLKNDFSVWGQRTGLSGAAIPVHMRYAIDRKPTKYTTIAVDKDDLDTEIEYINNEIIGNERDPMLIAYNNKYGTNVDGQESVTYTTDTYDWREIIYQMAKDYYQYAHILDDFEYRIIQANPEYPTGKTGYESYYIDLIGFWRELYDATLSTEEHNELLDSIDGLAAAVETSKVAVSNALEDLEDAKLSYATYKEECPEEERNPNDVKAYEDAIAECEDTLEEEKQNLNLNIHEHTEVVERLAIYENYYYSDDNGVYKYWNKTVYNSPQTLNFWFDFLDSSGELSQYSVKNIGCRPKAVNDSNVTAIYFRETPSIIFTRDITNDSQRSSAYTYINVGQGCENTMFSISGQGKSAKTVVDELLYAHGYCTESATITTIPIYYLEPNIRVQIIDQETQLNGYYTISKMSLPLTYNGTMSLTATRAASLEI